MKKNNILIYIFLFLIVSCGIKKNEIKNKNTDKTYFIKTFKGYFFKSCLKNGYNNFDNINNIINSDKSFNSDYLLGSENYKLIDSLSKSVYIEMKKDSLQSIGKRAEGAEGKKVLEKCLCFYESKKLDSIANVIFNKQKN